MHHWVLPCSWSTELGIHCVKTHHVLCCLVRVVLSSAYIVSRPNMYYAALFVEYWARHTLCQDPSCTMLPCSCSTELGRHCFKTHHLLCCLVCVVLDSAYIVSRPIMYYAALFVEYWARRTLFQDPSCTMLPCSWSAEVYQRGTVLCFTLNHVICTLSFVHRCIE